VEILLTHGVQIAVESEFQPGHSFPHRSQYLHVYTIHITNYNEYSIQLISRHWDITEADGTKKVVDGDGVVGQQPVIEHNAIHSYSSFCVLAFPYRDDVRFLQHDKNGYRGSFHRGYP
jgi:ApaG protein